MSEVPVLCALAWMHIGSGKKYAYRREGEYGCSVPPDRSVILSHSPYARV